MSRDVDRRTFVRAGVAVGVVGTGLLGTRVGAAESRAAFQAADVETALKALYGTAVVSETDQIEIRAPEIAENGAVVPVMVTITLPNPEDLAILGDRNRQPLALRCPLTPALGGELSTRIKLATTSNIVVVVKAGGKLYQAAREVKVTIGGWGG
ncbi:MAG: thiosulfate oxidation carrier protein SoxY [Fimbriimonadaceae bacterium]|nr:thiosulfate oxidation carrier protein SoxY [Fimbriimonadaceae bacterium]